MYKVKDNHHRGKDKAHCTASTLGEQWDVEGKVHENDEAT